MIEPDGSPRVPPPSKKQASQKQPVVLDTITTRFLMLFVIVLVIPLISLIIFTFSILNSHLEQNSLNQIWLSDYAIRAKLEEKGQEIQSVLTHFGQTPNAPLDSLCPQTASKICLRIHLDQAKAILPNGRHIGLQTLYQLAPAFRDNFSLTDNLQSRFYANWKNRLYLFQLYRLDPSGSRYLVMGVPVNNLLINELYRQNPSIMTGLWLLREPLNPEQPEFLALRPANNQNMSATTRQQILQQIQGKTESGEIRIDLQGEPFLLIQHFLYNPAHKKVARLVTLFPLASQKNLLGTYYLGIYIIVVASILFSVIVAILASRTITLPLLRLIDQVKSLNRSGDLSHPITVRGVYEINQLGTAFNQMLERLQQEHKIKDDFVATLTHDLKVPLLAEKQTLAYLSQGTYGELLETQGEVIGVLRSANQSNLDLVNGILEIYRYESDQVKLMFESVPIDELMEETVNELKPLAEEKQIQLVIENALNGKRPAEVRADRLEIRRVLINLISNALTNTPKHGTVRCRLEDRNSWGSDLIYRFTGFKYSSLNKPLKLSDHILVSVQDSGIGFASDDLPHLFRQFAANRGRNPMSIGLGLYNCYQVIQAHGGSIWVETTEGEGSAVSFLLPQNIDIVSERRKTGERRQN